MQRHAVHRLPGLHIPDDYVRAEAHERELTGGQVSTVGGDGQAGHLIGVALEEGLRERVAELLHHHGRAEGVNQRPAVGVQHQPAGHLAVEADDGLEREDAHVTRGRSRSPTRTRSVTLTEWSDAYLADTVRHAARVRGMKTLDRSCPPI